MKNTSTRFTNLMKTVLLIIGIIVALLIGFNQHLLTVSSINAEKQELFEQESQSKIQKKASYFLNYLIGAALINKFKEPSN